MSCENLDLAYFKSLLNDRLTEINDLAETGDEAAQPVELDQTRVGRLSRMDAMQAQAMSLETKRRREIEFSRIKSALKRIEEDSFGECQSCFEIIPVARLKLDPSTLLCIKCAEQNE